MALADHYEEADVLTSLGWMGLSHEVRVRKVASLFLADEREIDRNSRTYTGPSTSNVGVLVKSLFKPPRGLGTKTITDTINEIGRQRAIKDARKKIAPSPPLKPLSCLDGYAARSCVKRRMSDLAESRYSTVAADYDGREQLQRPAAVGVGVVGDTFLLVDEGGHRAKTRIYMRHRPTNQEKVVVLQKDVREFTAALMAIAPKVSMRAMFSGQVISLDFEGEGFIVGDKLVPWLNVCRVYRRKGEGRIRTLARPKDNR